MLKLHDNALRQNLQSDAIEVLKLYLPESPLYNLLKQSSTPVPSELAIYLKSVYLQEQDDSAFRQKEVENRRRRLGAEPLEIIKRKVELEILNRSQLQDWYQRLIQIWKPTPHQERAKNDTEAMKDVQTKYFGLLEKRLIMSNSAEKEEWRSKLDIRVNDMIRDQSDNEKCCEIKLEAVDTVIGLCTLSHWGPFATSCVNDSILGGYDAAFLQRLTHTFPRSWLSKFASFWQKHRENDCANVIDALQPMVDQDPTISYSVTRLLAYSYYAAQDYESALISAEKSKSALEKYMSLTGRAMTVYALPHTVTKSAV